MKTIQLSSFIFRLALPFGLALLGLTVFLHNARAASREDSPLPQGQESPTRDIIVTTTIQAAIDAAADGDIVNIPSGTYTETLTVNKNITLKGASPSSTFIMALPGHRVITVPNGHNLRLEGVGLFSGHPIGEVYGGNDGGGIYATGNLQIVNTVIDLNQANFGGGVYQFGTNGHVDVTNSVIQENHSAYDGAGFYVTGKIVLTDTWVTGNTANRHGGGLHVQDGLATIIRGSVWSNTAAGNGGGLNTNNGVTLLDTSFNNNTSGQDGGGLLQWNLNQPVNVSGTTFQLNRSYHNGGGIWARGNLTVTNTTVISNTAGPDSGTDYFYGGGIYLSDGSIQVITSTLRNNKFVCPYCTTSGGGLFADFTTKSISILGSTFEKNNAWIGGGLVYTGYDTFIHGSTFKDNQAGYAGAINIYGGTIQDTDFINNYASNIGGALWAQALVQVSGSRFIDNSSTYAGGGAIGGNLSLQAVNTLFADNHSDFKKSVLQLTGAGASALEQVTIASLALGSDRAISVTNGTLSITNTIITNYQVAIGAGSGGVIYEDYNLFFGNGKDYETLGGGVVHNGVHNVTLHDPLFVNPALGDYHLGVGSPAINKGKDLGVLTDLDGQPRDATPDIGAYEFQAGEFRAYIYLPIMKK
jgi:hypothetical protein